MHKFLSYTKFIICLYTFRALCAHHHKFLFYNKFIIFLYMFRALCAHYQEVKIVLYSIWYHHTCRWPSRAQVETKKYSTFVCFCFKIFACTHIFFPMSSASVYTSFHSIFLFVLSSSVLSLVYALHTTVFLVQGTPAKSQPSIGLSLQQIPVSAAPGELLHDGHQRGTGDRKCPSRGYKHPFQSSSNITQPLQM